MSEISLPTVALSALVSVLTGYVGALLSTSWQRRQDRRTYGLALLAEVRSIRRGLLGYGQRLDLMLEDAFVSPEERRHVRNVLPYWRHDTSVFSLSSSRIGLFSPALAVAILEFYSRVRWLDTRATQAPDGETPAGEAQLRTWLGEHRRAVRHAQTHSRQISRALRRETPPTLQDALAMRRRRRLMHTRRALLTPRHGG